MGHNIHHISKIIKIVSATTKTRLLGIQFITAYFIVKSNTLEYTAIYSWERI